MRHQGGSLALIAVRVEDCPDVPGTVKHPHELDPAVEFLPDDEVNSPANRHRSGASEPPSSPASLCSIRKSSAKMLPRSRAMKHADDFDDVGAEAVENEIVLKAIDG